MTGRASRSIVARIAGRLPRRLVLRLPLRWSVPILAMRSPRRRDVDDRRTIPLAPGLSLEAYWLRSASGTSGPAASVHHGIEELLRIDGLRGDCHVHYDLAQSRARSRSGVAARRTVTVDDIPGWAAEELRSNLRYSLSLQHRSAVRRLQVDQAALDRSAQLLEAEFVDLLAIHGHEPDAVR